MVVVTKRCSCGASVKLELVEGGGPLVELAKSTSPVISTKAGVVDSCDTA